MTKRRIFQTKTGGRLCFSVAVLLMIPAFGAQEMPLARYFGFGPIDILKVEDGISGLTVCDFNGDGLNDIAVINNRQSRIEMFLRRREPQEAPAPARLDAGEINRLGFNPNFAAAPILVTVRPVNLAAGDFNGDGLMDLACYADPAGLYVLYQTPSEGDEPQWQAIHKIRIDDGLNRPDGLKAGDLNGDGRTDLALAGENGVYVLLQDDEGAFGEPRLLGAEGSIQEIRIGRFNDDLHADLLMVTADPERPIAVRFGYGGGEFSPLIRYECDPPVSPVAFDLFDGPGQELLYIDKRTGRLTARQFAVGRDESQESGEASPFAATYPLQSPAEGALRDLAWGDFNGDGRLDIAVTEPQAAKVLLYLQDPVRGISSAEEYPGFAKTDAIRAADIDLDGKDALVMISVEERAIGVSRFDNGRLTFPHLLEIEGQPLAMDMTDADGDGRPECLYVSRDSDDRIWLRVYEWDTDGINLSAAALSLESVRSNPDGLRAIDVNADGLADVIIFRLYEDPVLIVQKTDHTFEVVPDGGKQSGLIKSAAASNLIAAEVNGDGRQDVLIARQNFARHLRFAEGVWQIVDQFNAAGRDDQILVAQAADLTGDNVPEILLLDGRKNRLQVLQRDEKQTYRVIRQIDVGPWNPGKPLRMLWESFGGREQLLLFDGAKFALLDPARTDEPVLPSVLAPVFVRETTVEGGGYSRLTCGDINSDGRPDLICAEYKKNHIEVLTIPPGGRRAVPATRFRVFEEKRYSDSNPRTLAEPRELTAADLTGDGLDDLAAILHDRIILYPQDR